MLHLVWPLPISLATTFGISVDYFSSPYLDVSVQAVPHACLFDSTCVTKITLSGFPHSDISGSQLICSSPKLFAAYHVLHRLQEPRHPPYALSYLFAAPRLLRAVSAESCTFFYLQFLVHRSLFTFFACFDSFSFLISEKFIYKLLCYQEEFSLLSNMS